MSLTKANAIRLPFWASPWRRGFERDRGFIACTVATSRSNRKVEGKSIDLYAYDDELANKDPAERKTFLMYLVFGALQELNIVPNTDAIPETPREAVKA